LAGGFAQATPVEDARLSALPPAELPPETWLPRLLTGFGTAVDSGVMRAMQLVVERALIPDPARIESLRESAQPLLTPALQEEPRRFFSFLDEPPHALAMASRRRRRLSGGAAISRRLESGYAPFTETISASAGPILVEHWVHQSTRPRGTVVVLHGFTMGNPRLDAFLLLAGTWYRSGLDVAMLTLPHHGARTPPDARFSGERFAVPHVARLSEAVREAVYEIRQLVHWLREESGAPVGLIGLSLGGYLTALYAGLADDVDFAIPMVPPVCIGDLAWRFFRETRHHREGGAAALSQQELRRAFRVHSPLAHPLRIARGRVMIVAGRGDRIVPPEHPAALWAHWGEPRIHWFSGSHLTPFGRARIARAILDHLESIEIL
jgi:pimeloyl-ACP methyl ester carboxylesterase